MEKYLSNPVRRGIPAGERKNNQPGERKTAVIDWNEAWKKERLQKEIKKRDVFFWNNKARNFFKRPWNSNYPADFLKIMEPKRYWTVLDMACGSGALALPLSKYVRSITAVDFSPAMLEILEEQCRLHDINNVAAIRARWEDNWKSIGIGRYDVVIASRCLVVDDLRKAITKLHNAARERVYISTIVGDGPHDRSMYEAVNRKLSPGPDYIFICNLLYQMGIYAHLSFIKDYRQESFEDLGAALEYYDKSLGKLNRVERSGLSRYLEKELIPKNGKWVFKQKRITRWAVMWWEKDWHPEKKCT